MTTQREIINKVIGIEGGYANDPADSGGETKYGITHAIASQHGYGVKSLTTEQAYAIYASDYWEPLHLDRVLSLSDRLTEELFDTAVNMGVARAVQFLQRSLNGLNDGGRRFPDVVVDGVMGQQTLEALTQFMQQRKHSGETVLFNMLNSLQSTFYLELAERRPKDERFNYGWQNNRVERIDAPAPEERPVDLAPSLQPTLPSSAAIPPTKASTASWIGLKGKKTYIVAAITAGISLAEYMGVVIPAPVYGVLGALGLTTLRHGMGGKS